MLGAINSFASLITPLRYVSIPAQACEIVVEVGMANGLSGKIGFEVALGDVGAHFSAIDQNVIPRCFFRRTGSGDCVIPVVRSLEIRVDINDASPVFKKSVLNELPDRKIR